MFYSLFIKKRSQNCELIEIHLNYFIRFIIFNLFIKSYHNPLFFPLFQKN
jgi:hypothetical protein